MRVAPPVLSVLMVVVSGCASVPNGGALGEGSTMHARIAEVDTTRPPASASIDLDQPGYVAVVLVAPGHSATLLYPADSTADNRLGAGRHQVRLRIPGLLVQVDSLRNPDRLPRARQQDSSIRNPGRQRYDTIGRARGSRVTTISPTIPTYLLLVASPKPLLYPRLLEKTAGVSIPAVETEALNAVAKAIKSTIATEPREWVGWYQRIELRRRN